jgi:glutamate-1-semialdehyde 2,1-aminomutase
VLVLGSHNISYSHTESDIDKLLSVYDEVFQILEDSISNNKLHALLTVEPLKPLFKVR